MKTAEELAADAEALRAAEQEQETDENEEEGGEDEEKSPPGFKSYEEYVADGGDPEMYKGKKAYEAEHKRIDEIKALRKELKTYSKTVMDANEEWRKAEYTKIKAELESRLEEQKKAGDIDGALETKEQLTGLKKEERQPVHEPHPVIQEFIEENPILDKDSAQFNQEFFDDMARLQAKKINSLSDKGGADLTEKQVLKCTKAAFEEAKELNRELFVSPRNDRQGAGRQARGGGKGEGGATLETRLKNLRIQDNRNPEMNGNAAFEMYQTIKERDPKAAEKFARGVLGD